MPTPVVLSDRAHYEALLAQKLDFQSLAVFCDNERFYSFLDVRGIRYEKLEETQLKEHWGEINEWGVTKALAWIGFCRQNNFFKKMPDLASVVNLHFSRMLIQACKNRYYARSILRRAQADAVIVFSETKSYDYPRFSGNAWLNLFLEEACREQNIRCIRIKASESESADGGSSHLPFPSCFIPVIKRILRKLYGVTVKPPAQVKWLAYGSPRHLGPVVKALHQKGKADVLFEREFRLIPFLFALRNGLTYLTPSCFKSKSNLRFDAAVHEFAGEFSAALRAAADAKLFRYQDYDLGKFVTDVIFKDMRNFFRGLAQEFESYTRILDCWPLQKVLVDEDFNTKAFFAAFMRRNNVDVFCVSHANSARDFCVPDGYRIFSQSTTLVHSEFEKEATYAARGWDPASVCVTGIPRYDRLARPNSAIRSAEKKPVKLLFCAGYLWRYSPETLLYLGSQVYFRHIQEHDFREIAAAIDGLPVELVVKPHHRMDEPPWRKLVEKVRSPNRVRVADPSTDFIDLLLESDGMLLSYWSTTLIEAAILRKPTLYLDFQNYGSPSVKRFSEQGFCRIVRSVSELRSILDPFDPDAFQKTYCCDPETLEYYLGCNDGNATARVAELFRAGSS